MIKKKKYLIPGLALCVIGIAALVYFQIKPGSDKSYKIRKGNLEVVVNCKGEVRGEKYTEINLPDIICDEELHIYQYKLADVILEGKAVKKGDYIAKLDDSQIMTNMRNFMQEKEKIDSDLRDAMLDSAVNLSQRREAINNAKLDLEYLKIDLEQSKYESEAYQRKTQMNYQKAEIEVDKITRNYLLEKNRQKLRVTRHKERVAEYQVKIDKYQAALSSTTITTPEDGIVMFAKDRNGKAYGKDSQIDIWRPSVATLPDMSVAITETFIREIDISKIEVNDSVRITIDALPDKIFWGKVIKIANVGEDHKDFDMKVFRVVIRFERSDKEMKPGMNANSDIVIASYQDKLLVPLKAIFSKDGKQIVYLKKGGSIREQEVEVVAENDQFGVVEQNIQEGNVVLLYQPEEFKPVIEKVAIVRQ
jgi:multidrug efflux pump subunit AcrA (membrane-fusion protein)